MSQVTQPINIDRYGECRTCDAVAVRYVTIRDQKALIVRDDRNGEDITSDVLTSLAIEVR